MNAVAIRLSVSLSLTTCSADVIKTEAMETEAFFLHDLCLFFLPEVTVTQFLR